MCFVLFSAGIDTVTSLLGSALMLLAEHPHARSVALPVAIEEILRYESPLQFNWRTTTIDAAVGDDVIPAGERVLLLYGSANRDERRFESPDAFDVAREPKRHLAFGEGIHFCIGAPLARLQTRVALDELYSRFPGYGLAGPVGCPPPTTCAASARCRFAADEDPVELKHVAGRLVNRRRSGTRSPRGGAKARTPARTSSSYPWTSSLR